MHKNVALAELVSCDCVIGTLVQVDVAATIRSEMTQLTMVARLSRTVGGVHPQKGGDRYQTVNNVTLLSILICSADSTAVAPIVHKNPKIENTVPNIHSTLLWSSDILMA